MASVYDMTWDSGCFLGRNWGQIFEKMHVFLNELLKQRPQLPRISGCFDLFRPTAGSKNCRWRTARSQKKGRARWIRRRRMTWVGVVQKLSVFLQYTRISGKFNFENTWKTMIFSKGGVRKLKPFTARVLCFVAKTIIWIGFPTLGNYNVSMCQTPTALGFVHSFGIII